MRLKTHVSIGVLILALAGGPALADGAAIKKWVDTEFQPSTLSKDDQTKELEWFAKAAEPYKGMEINVVSETLTVHKYESEVLAKAFEEITGIKVKHDIIQEGDVVEKIQTQMQSAKNVYDGWINNSDFIGTHPRYNQTVNLTDWMAGEAKDVTDPMLDVDDFIGKSFTTWTDKKLYQLPDQQFANLYWFRYDWFTNPDIKAKFKAKYGYELGVPVNWSAYEDIADFFTNDIKEIDGVRVYGHMDYGKKDPSLGWRFTDAWLSMAGNGDKGIPNGIPVDEWGIRMEGCRPVGSSVERGGDVNGPASVYANSTGSRAAACTPRNRLPHCRPGSRSCSAATPSLERTRWRRSHWATHSKWRFPIPLLQTRGVRREILHHLQRAAEIHHRHHPVGSRVADLHKFCRCRARSRLIAQIHRRIIEEHHDVVALRLDSDRSARRQKKTY